jgi:protein-disulfide isomerase
LILPLLALAVSVVVWYRVNDELATLRQSQRALIAEVAALKKNALIDLTGAQSKGSEDAIVTLVEFSDYECPYCIRHFQQTMPDLETHYISTGKIRYVFRDFPVDQLHPEAVRAHEAAHCAGEQNKFWDLHARLFSAAGTHTMPLLEQRGSEAGLDLAAYRTCVASGRSTAAIRASSALAMELGANGTPAFFVGVRDRATNQMKVTQAISGAQSFSVFARVIDAVLKQVQGQ